MTAAPVTSTRDQDLRIYAVFDPLIENWESLTEFFSDENG